MSVVKIPTDAARRGLALFQAHANASAFSRECGGNGDGPRRFYGSRVYAAHEMEDLAAASAWIADQLRVDQERMEIRLDYDDDQLSVVDKINVVLEAHGLVLVDDNLPHDAYCLFTLQAIKSNP